MDRVEAAEAAFVPPPAAEEAQHLNGHAGGEELPSAEEALEQVRLAQETEDRAAAEELADAAAGEDDSPILRLALATLRGDIRDAMLDVCRHTLRAKSYDQLGEDEQRAVANRMDTAAGDMVRGAVELLANRGSGSVMGALTKATATDKGVKLEVVVVGEPAEEFAAFKLRGHRVVVASSDSLAADGERAPVEITPDQPGLPLGEKSRRMTADETKAAQDTAVAGQVEIVGDPQAEGETVELATEADEGEREAAGSKAPGIRKARGRRPRKQL